MIEDGKTLWEKYAFLKIQTVNFFVSGIKLNKTRYTFLALLSLNDQYKEIY